MLLLSSSPASLPPPPGKPSPPPTEDFRRTDRDQRDQTYGTGLNGGNWAVESGVSPDVVKEWDVDRFVHRCSTVTQRSSNSQFPFFVADLALPAHCSTTCRARSACSYHPPMADSVPHDVPCAMRCALEYTLVQWNWTVRERRRLWVARGGVGREGRGARCGRGAASVETRDATAHGAARTAAAQAWHLAWPKARGEAGGRAWRKDISTG